MHSNLYVYIIICGQNAGNNVEMESPFKTVAYMTASDFLESSGVHYIVLLGNTHIL